MKKRDPHMMLRWSLLGLLGSLLAACASIGRPEGGPRDYRPPVYLRSSPASGQTNVSPSRIDIYFDENVQLEDAFNKVIISPVQATMPVVRANGRRVSVELRDTLLPNTTYTIDFGDAIKDLNEGNILDGFAIDFSTGDNLDSLRISGMVFEARNLEPAQGMTIGVTSNLSDTALTSVPFERVARTNQLGQFTVRNLKPGAYRVYAINDVNRDNMWDRTEDIAFYDVIVEPGSRRVMVTDTIIKPDGTDSVFNKQITVYSPDDVLLTWFNEDYKPLYVKDYSRPERQRIELGMGARGDSLPVVTIVDETGDNLTNHALYTFNPTRDSLTFWLKEPSLIEADTLKLSVSYPVPDSLGNPTLRSDTLSLIYREPKKKVDKDPVKQAQADSIAEAEARLFALTSRNGSSLDLRMPFILDTRRPIQSIDTTMVHLSQMVDTTWTPVKLPAFGLPAEDDKTHLTRRMITYDWMPGTRYRLEVDSAAVTDIYGAVNKPFSSEISTKKLEDYANLTFKLRPLMPDSTPLIVELLNGQDQVTRFVRADTTGTAVFELVTPGTYYARAFIDANNNGEWDKGSVSLKIQPEEVAYYNKKIDARANWDNDLEWDIYVIPIDQQKPYAIKKNRPKLKKGEKAPQEDDEEVDEWGEPLRGNNRGSGNRFSIPGGAGGKQQIGGNSSSNLNNNRRR